MDYANNPVNTRKWKTGNPRGRPPQPHILTPKQLAFIAEYFKDGNGARAARAVGYKGIQSQHRLLRHPLIVEKIREHGRKMAEKTGYNQEALTAEINEAMQFARETKNANALVKAIELKGKAHGLIIDKHDVRALGSFSINIVGLAPSPNPLPMVGQQPTQALPVGQQSVSAPIEATVAESIGSHGERGLTVDIPILSKSDDDDGIDPFSTDA